MKLQLLIFRHRGREYRMILPRSGAYVITGKYAPSELGAAGDGSPPAEHKVEIETFEEDCFKQIIALDLCPADTPDFERHIGGLVGLIADYIDRCGYISFAMLLTKLDSFAYLLSANHFKDEDIRRKYIIMARVIVEVYADKIRDGVADRPFGIDSGI